MTDRRRGRPSNWGDEIDTIRVHLPLRIVTNIDIIHKQINDPVRAEQNIVERLTMNVSKTTLKMYDGRVSAGCKVTAFSDGGYEEKEVPTSLLREPEKSFLLKVSGDSMEDAGIHNGSIIAIEQFKTIPPDRTIVLASVEDQLVVKEYRYRRKRHELVSKNKRKNYSPIVIDEYMSEHYSVEILGLFDTVVPAYLVT